jgi:hypothetical protein
LGRNDLLRRAVNAFEGRPQRLVPANDLIYASLQCGDIERSRHTKLSGDVVDAAPRLKLVQKPQALLGKGKR